MRKSIFMLLLVVQQAMAQVNVVNVFDCNSPMPVTQEQLSFVENEFHKECVTLSGNLILQEQGNKEISAEQYIVLKPNVNIGSFDDINGSLDLKIKPKKLDIFALLEGQNDLNAIPARSKLELAVGLPGNITSQVADFLLNGQTGSNINPFDPQQLDIHAEFWYQWQGNWVGPIDEYGFYYEDFVRDGMGGWIPGQELAPRFRIRFSPRIAGNYSCRITVSGQQFQTIKSNEFFFNVVPSNLKEFIYVGNSGRFLKKGNSPFFPVGVNMPFQGDQGAIYSTEPFSSSLYEPFFSKLDELEDAGANYFRFMLAPWNNDIEFEKLGDYSDRLQYAWELDQLIDYLSDKELWMHLNLSYHTPFLYPDVDYKNWQWDWSGLGDQIYDQCYWWLPNDQGYCYHADPDFGVETPKEFLTNVNSQRYYKNRLRYILARWGYSSSIAMVELFNEMNNLGINGGLEPNIDTGCAADGSKNTPYHEDPSYPVLVGNWNNEMASYIKNEIRQLDHPLVVNYTGKPAFTYKSDGGCQIYQGDMSYYSDAIDIISYNDYGLNIEKYRNQQEIIDTLHRSAFNNLNGQPVPFGSVPNPHQVLKPLIYSEIGISDCDYNISWKEDVILSSFTGACGAALPWFYNSAGPEYNWTTQRADAWKVLGAMKEFMAGIDFDNGDWLSGQDVKNNDRAQMLYLQSQENHKRAVGVVDNQTVNYYSIPLYFGENSCNYDENLEGTVLDYPAFDNPNNGGPNAFKLHNMGWHYYRIDWYNPMSGNLVQFSSEIRMSSPFGQLKIIYPQLGSSIDNSIFLFKVRRLGDPQFSSTNNNESNTQVMERYLADYLVKEKDEGRIDSTPVHSDSNATQMEQVFYIVPNPTSGKCIVVLTGTEKISELRIVSSMGQEVFTLKDISNESEFDLSFVPSGIYYAIPLGIDSVLSPIKIIKQ